MTLKNLEHIIRAAAATSNANDIIVIGSQSILATHADAPSDLLSSIEADVYPKQHPERSILIDSAIGELSLFHQTFGYYAHGVGPETAILPIGWIDRLCKIHTENTRGATGWCLEPHDLAVSKLAAAREKDYQFVETMLKFKLIRPDLLFQRLENTPSMHLHLLAIAKEKIQSWTETEKT